MEMTRRRALATFAAASSTLLFASGEPARAEEAKPARAGVAPGAHAPVPLPFDARKLTGISERLIVSHHDNNYAGAVKNLNAVELELAKLGKDTPGFTVFGLKERELSFTNSMILHEHYFGNLGGDGKAGAGMQSALATAFGGFARWEEQFRATGMSLAGGSGWVVLAFNFQTGDLRTYAAGNHTQSVAFGAPLLVMDMYEHAYQMDYGAAAAKYVDAFFTNIQWDEVERRHARALKAAQALQG